MKYCIVCDKELENYVEEIASESIGVVYGATIWRSYGNYGSTIYDPMSGDEFLEVCICDECLKKKHEKVQRMIVTRARETVKSEKFNLEPTPSERDRTQVYKKLRDAGVIPMRAGQKLTMHTREYFMEGIRPPKPEVPPDE
jgi:hypothetical protein